MVVFGRPRQVLCQSGSAFGRTPEQIPGDDFPLEFRRSFVDARRAHLAVEMLEEVAARQRDRAMNLDRGVDHLLRGLGGKSSGHSRPVAKPLRTAFVELWG